MIECDMYKLYTIYNLYVHDFVTQNEEIEHPRASVFGHLSKAVLHLTASYPHPKWTTALPNTSQVACPQETATSLGLPLIISPEYFVELPMTAACAMNAIQVNLSCQFTSFWHYHF